MGKELVYTNRLNKNWLFHVTGALCRKTDLKIATTPKTQSRSKDENKDKDYSK